ncbi:MAG TPA: hypothetical protein VNM87_05530 [Candidatus Udaeobacter sp.]|nr:hypothetical protein [Candidatus Udaeobacter sp.]
MPISPWKSALLYLGLAVLGPWASALAGGDAAAVPGPVFETLRVDADSLRITLELPMTALAPIGVLHFRDSADPKHAVVNADSLAAYLKLRMILIQDDGMLVPVIRQITTPKGDPPIARVEMVAGLLDTYTHIGVASGLFREQSAPTPTHVRVEWRGARAEFQATQAIQWVEPPAKGATVLELPGHNPAPAAGH